MSAVTVITIPEMHERFRAQGVKRREDIAFKCARCGTVQSLATFQRYGVYAETAEQQIGFSCIGRHTDELGCDWTLGGLFQIHTLAVVNSHGKEQPSFEPASPEEAQALAATEGSES